MKIYWEEVLSHLDNLERMKHFLWKGSVTQTKRTKLEQKDLNVKKGEKVDEDNYIYELNRDDDKAILDMIEKDDEKIAKVRELNKNGVYDVRMEEKINLENKMIMHKKKWMSTVPTAMEYFNSGIKNEDNKFIL